MAEVNPCERTAFEKYLKWNPNCRHGETRAVLVALASSFRWKIPCLKEPFSLIGLKGPRPLLFGLLRYPHSPELSSCRKTCKVCVCMGACHPLYPLLVGLSPGYWCLLATLLWCSPQHSLGHTFQAMSPDSHSLLSLINLFPAPANDVQWRAPQSSDCLRMKMKGI